MGKYIPVKWDRVSKGMEVGRAEDMFRTQLDCGVDYSYWAIEGNEAVRIT